MDQDEQKESVDQPISRFSTSAQIAGIIGVVATLCAGMLWLSGQRTASSTDGGSPATIAGPTHGHPKLAEADAKRPQGSESPTPEKPTETAPPKVILDWIDYSGPDCEDRRAIGVNIIETRGKVDSVTLIWRAKEKDIENSRRIYRHGNQWTAYLQGLPSDTDVRLLAVVNGPGGEVTLGANVSRYC